MILSQKSQLMGVKQKQGEVSGLSFVPTIAPEYDDNSERVNFLGPQVRPVAELTDGNLEVIFSHMQRVRENCKGILEIGVARPKNRLTSAQIFLSNKKDETPYLGIDIDDKTHLNNGSKNIHTIQCSSFEQDKIRAKLKEINLEKISILMIDGDHSVNAVINDWKYTDLLDDSGIVILHDTNFHPGPIAILDAIDKNLYDVTKFFEDRQDDYGISVVYRKVP